MPPLKAAATKKSSVSSSTENTTTKTMSTRSAKGLPTSSLTKENAKDVGPKRKAASPIKGNILKRTALGNLTNAIETQCVITTGKKINKKITSTVTKPTISTAAKASLPVRIQQENVPSKSMLPPLPKSRLSQPVKSVKPPTVQPRPSLSGTNLRTVASTTVAARPTAEKPVLAPRPVTRQSPSVGKKSTTAVIPVSKCKVTAKPKCMVNTFPNTRRSSSRRSTLDSTDSSLYVSALSDVSDTEVTPEPVVKSPKPLPKPELNIDEEYLNDPYQCAIYAYDIFQYLMSREEHFRIQDYMDMQTSLSQHVRAILVDWMVEIQENFEMNHETLYLGVKLVDSYLSRIKVSKASLQLIGATAMFIAAKYDERIPPAIDDFLYICDGVYVRKDMIKMEVNMLRVIGFELGFPLSYRFLRRYARCAKVPMPMLTLARYILEHSLMDYSTISLSDSKMAAAALYLAFKMKKENEWDSTLIYFSGYKVADFIAVAHILNNSLHIKPKSSLATVRNKYSHQIFFEVAKIPLVSNEVL